MSEHTRDKLKIGDVVQLINCTLYSSSHYAWEHNRLVWANVFHSMGEITPPKHSPTPCVFLGVTEYWCAWKDQAAAWYSTPIACWLVNGKLQTTSTCLGFFMSKEIQLCAQDNDLQIELRDWRADTHIRPTLLVPTGPGA